MSGQGEELVYDSEADLTPEMARVYLDHLRLMKQSFGWKIWEDLLAGQVKNVNLQLQLFTVRGQDDAFKTAEMVGRRDALKTAVVLIDTYIEDLEMALEAERAAADEEQDNG